jgi:TonB family protein
MNPLFRRAFHYSMGVHVFLIIAAITVSLFSRCQKDPDPVLFQLVSAGAPPSVRPEESRPSEELQPFAVDRPQPLDPIPDLPKPTPPKPVAPKKTTPRKPPPANISYEEWAKSRDLPDQRQVVKKKPTPRPSVPEIETNFRSRISAEVSAINIEGVSTNDMRDNDALQQYQVRLSQAIQRVFAPQGEGLTANAAFSVDPSGRIHSARISKSSGVAAFDNAVLRALQTARSPGPPPGSRAMQCSLTFRSQ